MVCDNSKRIVVIKNIHSNLIEEAIIVLKSKPDIKSKKTKASSIVESDKKNQHIIKEAEEIINNYVRERNKENQLVGDLKMKPFRPKLKVISGTFINLMLLASIGLVIFMVVKMY